MPRVDSNSAKDRIILHSDMNNFFASVECMENPELKNKYVAVCGRQEDRHGIVLAKNEKAKARGVKTGEPIWQAKLKCPMLVVVEPHGELYIKYSKLAHEIYYRYTDLIEPMGIDECWLDVTGSTLLFGNGYEIANKIREDIKRELNLTVSIGVSFTKIFAKLGSDMKKPDAVTCISREDFRERIWSLSATELMGVGRATSKTLYKHGINTIGDIANANPEYLKRWIGINGIRLWNFANGREDTRVAKHNYVPSMKSVGHGLTCVRDLANSVEVWRVIFELTRDVSHRLRKNKLMASGVSISIKDKDLHCKEYQTKLKKPTVSTITIAETAFELFIKNYEWDLNVRAVTIRAINLVSEGTLMQIDMFENINKELKRESIEHSMEEIRNTYGKHAVTYGSLIGDLKLPQGSTFDSSKVNSLTKQVIFV